MRLETVWILRRKLNKTQRRIDSFKHNQKSLSVEMDLFAVFADDMPTTQEESLELDCLLAQQLTTQLEKVTPELINQISELDSPEESMILYERYILCKPMLEIAKTMGYSNVIKLYALREQARNHYNDLNGYPHYKELRAEKILSM
ncbi:MAG: hypothetical protein IKZ53_00730 [Selenomonadaceae bacterium]|nr:hypothetical protein [Selenomonadaceae bacterium]